MSSVKLALRRLARVTPTVAILLTSHPVVMSQARAADAVQVSAAPALVSHVMPTYPQIAQAARVSGVVIVDFTIGVDGRVEGVRVVRLPSWIPKNFAFVHRCECRSTTVEIDSIARFVANTQGDQAPVRRFAFGFEREEAAGPSLSGTNRSTRGIRKRRRRSSLQADGFARW